MNGSARRLGNTTSARALKIALSLAAAACAGDGAAKLALYDACAEHRECASGVCLSGTPSVCSQACLADGDCPRSGLCVEGMCRGPTCADGERMLPPSPVACVKGIRRRCVDLDQVPCSQCGCEAGRYCEDSSETCFDKLGYGMPCTSNEQCPGDCEIPTYGGEPWLDDKSYCVLPIGTACWLGDPCSCWDGSCTYSCDEDTLCDDDSECVSDSGTGPGSCRDRCSEDGDCAFAGACVHAAADDVLSPLVCKGEGPRPPRPEGWPCRLPEQCSSRTCCSPDSGDTWGYCASAARCPAGELRGTGGSGGLGIGGYFNPFTGGFGTGGIDGGAGGSDGGAGAGESGGSGNVAMGGSGVVPGGGTGNVGIGGDGGAPMGGSGATPIGGSGGIAAGGSGAVSAGGSGANPSGGSGATPTGGTSGTVTGGAGGVATGGTGGIATGGSGGGSGGSNNPLWTVQEGGYVVSCGWHGYVWTSTETPSLGSTISPSDFSTLPDGGTPCVSGTVAASSSDGSVAMLGWNLSQGPEGEEPGVVTPTGSGIELSVSNGVGSALRIEIGDGVSDHWCASVTGSGGFIPWSAFRTECWGTTGSEYQMQPVTMMLLSVPGDATVVTPFGFCLDGVAEVGGSCGE